MTRNEIKKARRSTLIFAFLILLFYSTLVYIVFRLTDELRDESEDNIILAETDDYFAKRNEEWFELAEEDYMEDPLESEHIEQAIHEMPDKRYALTDEELDLVCAIVMAETGAEPYEGMMAVAQTILNHCEREDTRPAYVAYKYTDPNYNWTEEVWCAVTAVFFEGRTVTDEEILWFYAPALCTSSFHESQQFVIEIGGHRFFAEKEVK